MKYKQQLLPHKRVFHLLSFPFIWSVLIPLLILDVSIEIYHRVCFFLYGIPYVKRSQYIKVWDRTKLQYLSFLDKFNCAYCGYANGLMAYGGEIAARTEQYWCGVKHQHDPNFLAPAHHQSFADYGDKEGYIKKYENKKYIN